MLLDQTRPKVFRQQAVTPTTASAAIDAARAAAGSRMREHPALHAYAVHLAADHRRIVTVEAWEDAASAKRAGAGADLYAWAATDGVDPTPVDDAGAGVIIIDLFKVWRPLLRPVLAFNIRNGKSFNREPGCISTTVLRGIGHGGIATYARWRIVEDFLAAFGRSIGEPAATTDDVNRIAARKTLGLIRPDYHAYELIEFAEARR